MIVKFTNNIVRCDGTFQLSGYDAENLKHKLVDGPVTLSLKYKKRRRLVSGQLTIMSEFSHRYEMMFYEYYFRPNNPEKLTAILNATAHWPY